MFIGEYQHTIDEKGRVAIPIKYRTRLKDGAVVTKGLDNCLSLYSPEEWKKIAGKLASLPSSMANSRAYARLLLAGAMDVKLDKQGRIMLPEYLRKYAGIKKTLIIAGLYNRLELWDKKRWEEYKIETERESLKITEKLSELGV